MPAEVVYLQKHRRRIPLNVCATNITFYIYKNYFFHPKEAKKYMYHNSRKNGLQGRTVFL